MTLTTTQKSIQELLHGDRQYQIPDFQRPYVWEEQQAETLVNDLLGAWRTDDGDYFLGSIVLVQHPSGDDVDIIDGQQRLTTLCILVSLLRHLEEDPALRDELGSLLLIAQSRIKGLDERPRLSVRECDRDFFDTFIIGDNIDSLLDVDGDSLTRPSVRRIVANARAMLDVLSNPDMLMPSEISDFIRYLTLHVSLIEVSTDSYQAAHRIFSVLNTRGVPLSAADIFKARVLSRVTPDARAHYAALWEQSIDTLGTESPDAFLGICSRSPCARPPGGPSSTRSTSRSSRRSSPPGAARSLLTRSWFPPLARTRWRRWSLWWATPRPRRSSCCACMTPRIGSQRR